MCSSALVETIECYMDDVVECFEDFVKKSLYVFTVGIAALVAVIFYLLKSFHERSSSPALPAGPSARVIGNIDDAEYNREGYNKDGYNREGYDRCGFTREGFNRDGYDRQGFNREGFDKNGFTREGYNREGRDRKGYTREGFDKCGYDRQGYNREGFNKLGYNREGFNRDGYNKEGFNRNGFNRDGLKKCPSSQQCVRRSASQQCVSKRICPNAKIRPCVSRTLCTAATSSSLSNTTCSEEQLISHTLSGCSKSNCPSNKRMMGRVCPATKLETGTCKGATNNCRPTNKVIGSRYSCCSMCCDKEDH